MAESDDDYAERVASQIIANQAAAARGVAPVLPSFDIDIPGGGVDLTQPFAQGQQGAGNAAGGEGGTEGGSAGVDGGGAAESTTTSDPITAALSAIVAPLIAPLTAIGAFFSGLSWITLPSSWVRIFAGAGGAALLFFGIAALIREVKHTS